LAITPLIAIDLARAARWPQWVRSGPARDALGRLGTGQEL